MDCDVEIFPGYELYELSRHVTLFLSVIASKLFRQKGLLARYVELLKLSNLASCARVYARLYVFTQAEAH